MEITIEGGKVVTAQIGGHTIRTDQSLDNGGTNTAPSPFDLFLASIGTCAGIYVKGFCDNRQISAEGIKIIESVEYSEDKKVPSSIKLDIKLPADFPERYRDAVIHAAELCLVKKTIKAKPQFEIKTSLLNEET